MAISNTLVVRGKLFVQESEAMNTTTLDLATCKDLVVTGNQEVDGTALFSGPVQFNSPVTFNVVTRSLELISNISGIVTCTKQGTVNTLTIQVTSQQSLVCPTTLAVLPSGFEPLHDILVPAFDTTSYQQYIVKLTAHQQSIRIMHPGEWPAGVSLSAHICYCRQGDGQT